MGVGFPFINLMINAYLVFNKWFIDKKNKNQTQELAYYLDQHKLQMIKTSFIAIFNLSSFLANILNVGSVSLYLNIANICLEFFFIHLNYLKIKTQLITQNLKLLEKIKRELDMDEEESMNQESILKRLKSKEPIEPEIRLSMIEFLMNEQKLKANDYFYYFQLSIFVVMISNMAILQATGILDPETTLLIGIFSAYFYNCIQPYLSNVFLGITQNKQLEVEDPHGNTLHIKHGQLFSSNSAKTHFCKPEMLIGLLAKIALPILVTTLFPYLGPIVAIALLSSTHILISCIEHQLNKVSAPPEDIIKEPLSGDDGDSNVLQLQ
jgi:hypothetical protein